VTVQVQTQDGTASAGSDYTALPATTLTFGANETSKSVAVAIVGDTTVESNETFTVVLSNPTAAFLAKGTGTGTITDDDNAIGFSAATTSVAEGAGKVTLTLTRTGSNAPVSAQIATASGTATAGQDFTSATTTVSFAANETSTTVDIPIASDTLPEADETFTVTLSGPQGGATLGEPAATTVTILDDDAEPTVGLASTTPSEIEGRSAAVTVTLSQASGRIISVSYATRDGSATAPTDYTAASGVLSFAPGETSKSISIPLLRDGTYEGPETFALVLSAPTVGSASGSRTAAGGPITIQAGQPSLGNAVATITIQDADTETLTPNNSDERRGNNEARPEKQTVTEEQHQQQQLTNRSNKDDVYVEGNVAEVHLDDTPPTIVIALRDGPMVIRLAKGALFPSGIKVGA
jgi:chitinase